MVAARPQPPAAIFEIGWPSFVPSSDLEGWARDSFRQQLAEERITRAGIEAQLLGEILNLTQTIESLKHLLIRHGIDVPMPHVEPGEMTVIEGRKP